MPAKRSWNQREDLLLRHKRAARMSWDEIARNLTASRSTVIDRARLLGIPRLAPIPAEPTDDPPRDPLPAGHPIAWAVLTEGTLLADTRYPGPLPV